MVTRRDPGPRRVLDAPVRDTAEVVRGQADAGVTGRRGTDKTPNEADRIVGKKIRFARKVARMSMRTLGIALGVTSQQVHKYEAGENRVPASRVVDIAKVLNVSVNFIYDTESVPPTCPERGDERVPSEREVIALARTFSTVRSTAARRKIFALVESLASDAV